MRALLPSVLALAAAALAAVDEGPIYADLRVQGGLTGTTGHRVGVGLFCGDLSEGEHGAWAGVVLGVRLVGAAGRDGKLDGGDDVSLYTAGGQALGGLGFTLTDAEHLEILALIGGGAAGDHTTSSRASVVGHYREVGGELGWYHTFRSHWQLGVSAGWSRIDTRLDNGGEGQISGSGIEATGSVGWRF